jgi:hypothetical protein
MLRCQSMVYAIAASAAACVGLLGSIHAQELSPPVESLILDDVPNASAVDGGVVGVESVDVNSIIAPAEEPIIPIDASELEQKDSVFFGDWLGYNPTQNDTTWVTGNGDRLGIYSFESYPALAVGKNSSVMIGTGFHFVNGPTATDLPPRLFDLQLAHQSRKAYGPLILDTKVGIGTFTDFEGSVRKGVRFPGHAVGYYQWHPWLVSVLGIEFLDRDDVSLLPVAGIVWRPKNDIVAELVFPRPSLQIKTGRNKAMYINGELGGGTWAIERANSTNDNATYRDLRIMLGGINFGEANEDETSLEIGWAFARALEYRSANGNYHPDDQLIFRFRKHY